MKFIKIVILSLCCISYKKAIANEDIILELKIKDNKFEPAELHAPTGKKIKIKVFNDDATVEEFESVDLNREKIIAPGRTITIVLAPLAPGKYSFFGDFHPDTAQGNLIIE